VREVILKKLGINLKKTLCYNTLAQQSRAFKDHWREKKILFSFLTAYNPAGDRISERAI
jgi:hypothetical protein